MDTTFTMKDKKKDILEGYKQLIDKLDDIENIKENSEKVTDLEVESGAEKEITKKPSTFTVEGIVKGLAELKLYLSKALTDLSDKLITEAEQLEEIQKTISMESKNLEELHEIKITAETMDNLIRIHEEKKRIFEEEMTSTMEEWKKEKEEYELAVVERNETLKREREREEEEYTYNLALTRKKDKDVYEEEKAVLKKALKEQRETQEKMLADREATVAAQEADIVELRTRVENFPNELERMIQKARTEAIEQTERGALSKAELLSKDVEGEKKVAELRIKTLEDIVAKQTIEIEALSKQFNNATSQVQHIADKVIEGASGFKALAAVNEIALEQAKNVSSKK